MNNLCADIGYKSINHDGEQLCGDHVDVVFSEQLHGPLQFPTLPDPAAGVMGRAEDGGVNGMFPELTLHIRIVHTPDSILIQA